MHRFSSLALGSCVYQHWRKWRQQSQMAREGLLAWTLWLRAGSRVWFDSHGIFKISQLHVKEKKNSVLM